ncbi:hypothetical protein PGB90_002444 [Kerria lacca]
MINNTGTLLLQTFLYLLNTGPLVNQNISVTLLENSITDPLFENETMKCYGMYGCFSIIEPWKDAVRPVCNFPEHPTKINATYCLHTRYNPNECQYLNFMNHSSIFRSFFTPYHKTYFITHGFLESGDKPWLKAISDNILKSEDVNVILIDWGNGSLPPYTQAVANIRLVGRITALLIYTLKILTRTNTENVHLIGHSLGAHLSGYVGYTLKHDFNCSVGRITGMDPAQPHFSRTDPVVRLDISDAKFVDIIHTNAKPFINGGFGIEEPIGHLDFYPNNGDNQPGCNDGMMRYVKNENQSVYQGLRRFFSCDHIRSHEFFLESITPNSCAFPSVQCDSWENFIEGRCFPCKSEQNSNGFFCGNMGLHAINEWGNFDDTRKKGGSSTKLYTITNNNIPFCLSLYKITLIISNSSASIEHKGEIGLFSIKIVGTKDQTSMTKVSTERYFPPASKYERVIGGKDVGKIISATLHWEHPTTMMNIMTWRLDSKIHIGSIIIETFQDHQRLHLCPLYDEVLGSGVSRNMKPCKI